MFKMHTLARMIAKTAFHDVFTEIIGVVTDLSMTEMICKIRKIENGDNILFKWFPILTTTIDGDEAHRLITDCDYLTIFKDTSEKYLKNRLGRTL